MVIPALNEIKDHGVITHIFDRDSNAPAKCFADAFYPIDFSNYTEVIKAVHNFKPSGVMALNDFGVVPAAKIAKEFSLPGFSVESARLLTKKDLQKAAIQKAGILTPKFQTFAISDIFQKNFEGKLELLFPFVVKPAFSGGGSRGVGLIDSVCCLRKFIDLNKAVFLTDVVVLEEYVRGSEHSVEAIVYNGSPELLSVSDKRNYQGSMSVVQDLFFPGKIGIAYEKQIRTMLESLCKAFLLHTGAIHLEIIISNDKVYFLEIGGRPGGGLNFHPICEMANGYNYPKILSTVLCGLNMYTNRSIEKNFLAWHYFRTKRCRSEIMHLKEHPAVVDIKVDQNAPDFSGHPENDLLRPGYILFKAKSYVELELYIKEFYDI